MAARIVADRYELADRLGSGGGGVVWRAHDTSLGRTVAVKEIELAHHLPDDDRERLQTRALREARAAAQLEHPNVVNVYDVRHTDDAIFIIMEFVDAPSLQHLVASEGRLTPQRAAQIGIDVAAALAAAHAAGIVHRDIKPSNVLVSPQGAQVTDFGIATVTDDPSLTMTGQALGTPDFVSPEQVTEAPVGPETDVWSLGATLYHAVEGGSPFRRDGSMATVNAVVNDPPQDMTQAGPLAAVLRAMLTKDPAQRPTLDEVRRRLEAIVDGPGVDDATAAMAPVAGDTVSFTAPQPVPPAPPASSQPPPPAATPQEPAARPVRERPERPRTGALAAVAIGLVLLVIVVALLLTDDSDTTPTDTGTEVTEAPTDQDTPPPSPEPTTEPTTPEQTDSPEPSPEPTDTATGEPTPTGTPTEPTGTDDPTVVPSGWQTYEGPTYTVAHPPNWTTRDAPASAIDLVAPGSEAYLRVANTDSPAEDVLADTRRIADAFAQEHANYQEFRLEPTEYRDTEAAIWEYTFDDGQPLRAAHLNLSTGENGYALNYVAPPSVWQQAPERWEQFTASFAPE